jgi:hypothetical protein
VADNTSRRYFLVERRIECWCSAIQPIAIIPPFSNHMVHDRARFCLHHMANEEISPVWSVYFWVSVDGGLSFSRRASGSARCSVQWSSRDVPGVRRPRRLKTGTRGGGVRSAGIPRTTAIFGGRRLAGIRDVQILRGGEFSPRLNPSPVTDFFDRWRRPQVYLRFPS